MELIWDKIIFAAYSSLKLVIKFYICVLAIFIIPVLVIFIIPFQKLFLGCRFWMSMSRNPPWVIKHVLWSWFSTYVVCGLVT